MDYHRNPFPMFYPKGLLNVSPILTTDDSAPNVTLTKKPLVEIEYSIAAFPKSFPDEVVEVESSCDFCVRLLEIQYTNQSHWIGKEYYKRGPAGNDIHRTNVPHIRVEFRDAIWRDEMQQVYLGKAVIPKEVDK
ncbi:AMP deaminase [Populus alba x Populus x berolinensis]|nr:AMP deaminase [Populus alba x Populus x berolinensis]